MFKIFITLLSLVIFTFSYAQEDPLTIVAVGEAEQEKELISFKLPNTKTLNEAQQSSVKEFFGILKDDFAFYQHIFEVDKKDYSAGSKVSNAHYVVTGEIILVEKTPWLKIEVSDEKNKKSLFSERRLFLFNNTRTFAHVYANSIYKSITGKEGIFESKIIFVSDRTSTRKEIRKELYIMDFDGARRQRVTFQNSIIISPAISPDKQNVVFTLVDTVYKKRPNGGVNRIKNLNLYEMNLRSKKMEKISFKDGINSGATYNKNGDSIYLTLSMQKNADVYKMNLKSKELKRITSHFAADVDPHINADGSLLTFLSGRPGKAMIYTSDPKGVEQNVKRISFVGDFNAAPRFNPSGSEIVFSSWVDNRFDIYRIDSSGTNLVRLTKNFGSNEEPWFSPDGEFIVFSSQRIISRKKAVQDLYIMNRDGEIIKKITENYGNVYTPRWSN